jgi:uncharacterized protein YbjT (DUF2867 family)
MREFFTIKNENNHQNKKDINNCLRFRTSHTVFSCALKMQICWLVVLLSSYEVVIGFSTTNYNYNDKVLKKSIGLPKYFGNVDVSPQTQRHHYYHHHQQLQLLQQQSKLKLFSLPRLHDTETSSTRNIVVVAGATGYIGRAVVQESVRRGYSTIALVRNATAIQSSCMLPRYDTFFAGASVVQCNVEDPLEIQNVLSSQIQHHQQPIDAVISCLAAPSGTKKDTQAIDYQATINCFQAGQHFKAKHLVLLSAFCCRNPLLQLQQAKLRVEQQLRTTTRPSVSKWTVVRPTAFLKSISGQFQAIQDGAPYILFGDGTMTRCNPIAESELAEFIMDSLIDPNKWNRILNVGGPDSPLTNQRIAEVRRAACRYLLRPSTPLTTHPIMTHDYSRNKFELFSHERFCIPTTWPQTNSNAHVHLLPRSCFNL